MMLDTIGIVTTAATAAAFILTGFGGRTAPLWDRLIAGALSGAWVGVVVALTASGAVQHFAVFVALFAGSLLLAPFFWRGVPSRAIVALNVFRLLGLSFLFLLFNGQLGGPFPYFAGIGDIITGVFAIPIALGAAADQPNDRRLLTWNAFGLLDLLVAVFLGVTSSTGAPLHLFHDGAGSSAIGFLPWSLIPLVFVPMYMTGHVVIFMRSRSAKAVAPLTMSRSLP